jgi:O-antigen/teichoic acid export membrane protein
VAIGFSRVDWKLAVTFLGPGLFFFLIQLSGALTIQGSILIVSAFAGPASVAIFVTHRTLTNLIRQLIGALNSALWPELTTLEANGDYSRLRTVHRLFVKTCFAVCLFAGIWLHFTGTNVIEVWTLGKIGFDQTLLDVFLIFLVLQAPWLGSSVFPASFNRHKHLSKCYLGSAVLGLVLALFFVQRFGLMGVVLGLMVADLLVCGWFVPLNTCRMLGENTRIFWAEILLRSVPVISMVWSTAWGLSQLITVPELRIFIIGGTVVLVGVVSGYFFWLNEEERGKMLSIGTTIWNRVVTSKPGKA